MLVAQATGAGFEVIREQRRNEDGYCDFSSKQIAVRPDVAPTQAVKTLNTSSATRCSTQRNFRARKGPRR